MAKQWYVVHAYSNFEGKVKLSLEEHARLAGMEDMFGQILIPTEEVVEIREGVKSIVPSFVNSNLPSIQEVYCSVLTLDTSIVDLFLSKTT